MAFQLVSLVLASVLAASNGIIIDCQYAMVDMGYYNLRNYGGPGYHCEAFINTLDNKEAITAITDKTGSADPTLQTSDVKWFTLFFDFTLKIERFPSNMATIFPNLMGISWTKARLKTVSASDLAPYPNLMYFSVYGNFIRKLDGNLFQNNRQLQVIDFKQNRIDEVGPGLLNGLNFLTNFNFWKNKCVGDLALSYIDPPDITIADLQRELDFVCGPSAASESCSSDPCLANCTARAAALQIRANAVTESVYAPWYYKMRAFFKALTMW